MFKPLIILFPFFFNIAFILNNTVFLFTEKTPQMVFFWFSRELLYYTVSIIMININQGSITQIPKHNRD